MASLNWHTLPLCMMRQQAGISLMVTTLDNADGLVRTPNCCSKTSGLMHSKVVFAIDLPSDINTSAGCYSFAA
eukprot:12082312-Ditylum_brightwellii.AAC.1